MMNFTAFEHKLSCLLDEYKIAGMAAAITNCHEILWEKGFGVTSVEKPWDKMSPQTLSCIGSGTKFTAGLCIMQLVEQGKIDLDAPIVEYIPWFYLKDDQPAEKITIRRLLSHTAGLPNEYIPIGVKDEDRFEEILKDEIKNISLIANPSDNFFSYSNYGARLAACAMEHITGKRFSELCEELVLAPLGMEKSTFDICKAATYELALPHDRDKNGYPVVEHLIHINAARYAAGGMYSNVHEMTALARIALNDGAPLIKKESWQQMKKVHVQMHDRWNRSYGLSVMMRHYGAKLLYGHPGCSPLYYCCIWTEPESGYGIAFVINTEDGERFTTRMVPEMFVELLDQTL